MNYQKVILVGHATDNAKSQKSEKTGAVYTKFGLAVNDFKDKVTYFPVILFGDFATRFKDFITKGRQVMVEGRVEVNNNGRFNVVGENIQFGAKPTTSTKK